MHFYENIPNKPNTVDSKTNLAVVPRSFYVSQDWNLSGKEKQKQDFTEIVKFAKESPWHHFYLEKLRHSSNLGENNNLIIF